MSKAYLNYHQQPIDAPRCNGVVEVLAVAKKPQELPPLRSLTPSSELQNPNKNDQVATRLQVADQDKRN